MPLVCPICGGEMKRTKPVGAGLVRFRCTCGHSEDCKEDRALVPDSIVVVDGFQEFPSGKN